MNDAIPDLAEQPPPRVQGAAALRRSALVALGVVSLINLLNYCDRVMMTVVAQPVKAAFGLSDTQLGLLTGPAFVFVYIAATLVFGRLVDRWSRKAILAVIVALWSVMTGASGFVQSYLQLAIGRAGVGVGEAGSNPAALSLLSDYFPVQRRSMAVAVFNSVGMCGMLAGFMLGGWIAAAYGWRAAFFVAGPPGLILAVAALVFIREPVRGTHDGAAYRPVPAREAAAVLWRIPAFRWLIVATSLSTFSSLGMIQWLPVFFIRSHGMGLRQVGLFFGPALVTGLVLGMLAGGWCGDWLARRSTGHLMVAGMVSNTLVVPLYLVVLWSGSLPVALVFTLLASALAVFHSPAVTAALQTITPPAVRGSGIGVFNFSNGLIGQALLPFLVGVLSDALAPAHGTDALRIALSICVPLCLVSVAGYWHTQRLLRT